MESILISSKELIHAKRWDFDYFSPEFKNVIQKIHQSGWEVKYLKDIITDLTDGQHGYLKHLPEGIPLLRTTNLFEDDIRLDDVRYIAPEVHNNIKRSQLKSGDVLLATIGVTLGTAAVFDSNIGEANINQNLVKITPKPEINPLYLSLFLNSRLGRLQTMVSASKSVLPIISYSRLNNLLIPIPPRSFQDKIAQIMQEAYSDRQNKLNQAKELLQGIDQYVFGVLNISPEKVEENKRFLKSISSIRGGRFDVEFNMGFHKFDPYMNQVLPVETVTTFPKETQDPTTQPETSFNYIDIASIDIELGEIREVSEVLGSNAPSRARQVVHTGDIIISTVRPTRGAIALIPESINGFICSTGFSIIHPNDQVTSEYLQTALRLHTTLEQFGRRSSGSSYPAILDKDIKVTLIPVPEKSIQEEISTEVFRCRSEAKLLRSQAESVVAIAKARVEKMILGEEE